MNAIPYPSTPPTIDPNTGKEAANLSYYWNEYVVLPDGTLGAWVPYNPESQGYLSQYDPNMSGSLVGVHVGIPNATGGILDAVPLTIPAGALTVPAGGTIPPTQSGPVAIGPVAPTPAVEGAEAPSASPPTPDPVVVPEAVVESPHTATVDISPHPSGGVLVRIETATGEVITKVVKMAEHLVAEVEAFAHQHFGHHG